MTISRINEAVVCVLLVFHCSRHIVAQGTSVEFTDSDREVIVQAHNDLRSEVDPPAANMLKMEYSSDLEEEAKHYASRCIFAHSMVRDLGENLFATTFIPNPPTEELRDYIYTNWGVDERKFYNYNTRQCDAGEVCGHYTQEIWHDSVEVGCAISICQSLSRTTFTTPSLYLVCNYRPPGNVIDQFQNPIKPYERGPWCSNCPKDRPNCSDERLCAAQSITTTISPPPTTSPEVSTQTPAATEVTTQTPAPTETTGGMTQMTTSEAASPSTLPTGDTGTVSTTEFRSETPQVSTSETTSPTSEPTETTMPTDATDNATENTPLPLRVYFINDTPQINAGTITADFAVSSDKALLLCDIQPIDMEKVNCTSGTYTRSGLVPGRYRVRVEAKVNGQRKVLRRHFVVHGPDVHCSSVFINEGMTIFGHSAQADFQGRGNATHLACILDRSITVEPCRSPFLMHDLSVGQHRLKITPRGCGKKRSPEVVRFEIN